MRAGELAGGDVGDGKEVVFRAVEAALIAIVE